MKREKDVIALLESSGERKGYINRGLLIEGNRIATILGGKLSALIIGNLPEDPAGLKECGACVLYQVGGKGFDSYSDEAFAWAANEALRSIPFRLLLVAHSDKGRELAPRIASYLHTAAITNCVDICVRDGVLYYARSLFDGHLEQEVYFAEPVPEIASIKTNVLSDSQTVASTSLRVTKVPVEISNDMVRTRSLEIIPPDFKTADILDANRIVGVGAGCSEVMDLVQEFADLMAGSIGTTRPVVDDGLIPKKRMIGQTGKTVSPELYLALGISGSFHHVAGIQQSKTILSLNRDPRAPIFAFSDVGFICDLKRSLPKIMDRIKRYKEGLA